MALTGSLEDLHGTTHANAYAKVVSLNLDYMAEKAIININIFKDSAARTNGKEPVSCESYRIEAAPTSLPAFSDVYGTINQDAANMNSVKASYDALKTLGRFSGWLDA